MNKSELIAAVAADTKLSKKDAEAAVNAVTENITKALQDGDKVSIVGFGTFEVRDRAPKKGHNPKTGLPMEIEASKLPAFRAGKGLKEAVR